MIVDTALMDSRTLLDTAHRFAPVGGLFVGMQPPLAVSEEWERARARGDRPPGQARRHYALIHAHGCYDLVLDPSQRPPQQCAEAIVQRLHDGPPPTAFEQLARRASHQGL